MNKNDFRFDKTNDGRPMLIADVDAVSIDDVYDALKIMYPSRISNKGYFGAGIATEEICCWVSIDGVKINIDQDLFYVTIYPEEKGEGEKYLLEIIEKMDDILIGKTIDDKYTVLSLYKQGELVNAYRVNDEKSNKLFAMKVYNKQSKLYSPSLRPVILKEMNTMAKLNHPAIPKVIDILEDEKNIYIVSEYFACETLEDRIAYKGSISEEEAIDLMVKLCDVLGYLHKQNPPYIYREMKPANIIIQPNGSIKLSDIGSSTVNDALKRDYTCVFWTKGYAPTEQYMGQADIRSDIYALGMTLHHSLTGVDPTLPPYETKPIREIKPNLSQKLEAIILRCVNLNPNERFQNCDEIISALKSEPIQSSKKDGFIKKLFSGKNSKP